MLLILAVLAGVFMRRSESPAPKRSRPCSVDAPLFRGLASIARFGTLAGQVDRSDKIPFAIQWFVVRGGDSLVKMAVAAIAIRQPPIPLLRYGVALAVILIKAFATGPAIGERLQPSSNAACQPVHCRSSPALSALSPADFAHEAAPGHGGP
ncbi:hypothetical protein OPT61_g8366 [Boeremia exigua]|uniref:Uncharacterized protein n=1 Tax=Boeremia exigua TaxID=749465 RepID=A0ACC2HYY1_9PLEO|nr:hypothetical protein OPT61_g8366 [Boeremia exigua]